MRDSLFMLSPLGVLALVASGWLLTSSEPGSFVIGLFMLFIAREDGAVRPPNGEYEHKWLMWRRIGEVAESKSDNVVSFPKGPAA